MSAVHAPLNPDTLSGTVSFQPGSTTLSPMLKQTTVTDKSLPTLKLGSSSHESMRGSSTLDPAETLSPERRRQLKTPRVEGADDSTAVEAPEQQQPSLPPSVVRNGKAGADAPAPSLVATREASSSESDSDDEESDGDEMAGLARLVALRGGPKSSQRASPAITRRQSGTAVEKKQAAASAQACHTPETISEADGWEPAVKAKPKRDPSPKKKEDDGAPASAPAPGQGSAAAADDEDDDDWNCFYTGSKDASHRVKGKHGNNARQARCRQYAIDARTSQRQAATSRR